MMLSRYPELYGIEMMLKTIGPIDDNMKHFVSLMDMIYELGYNRGKQDAVLNSLMGDTKLAYCEE